MESMKRPTISFAGAASSRSAADPAVRPGTTERAAALVSFDRRLRELQDAYYDAPEKDDSIILEYLRVLAEARQAARTAGVTEATPRLHIGCGAHLLEGWINVDLRFDGDPDLRADAAALPFASGSAGFIHSEDLLEHLGRDAGPAFLAECFRVLRPRGVLRLLTPDLKALVENVYEAPSPRHLRWCAAQLDARDPCEALNMHLRMNGRHRFVYDEDHLHGVLRRIGFRVERVRFNRSAHPELCYLDLRDFGLNLFLEAQKPA
jgi:predicted SAM-dependent methyltransferase